MQHYYFKIINQFKIIFAFFAFTAVISCDMIFEEDIEDDKIIPGSPMMNDTIKNNTILFSWDELEGAVNYHLQVVEPTFTNKKRILIDSLVTDFTNTFQLNPGVYQWRVRGVNNGYETKYTTPIDFVVDSIHDLTNQSIVLLSPRENAYINNLNTLYQWQSHYAADNYKFQLFEVLNSSENLISDEIVDASEISVSINNPNEGKYKWQVQGINETSQTTYFSNHLIFDETIPLIPTQNFPIHQQIISSDDEQIFSWNYSGSVGIDEAPLNYRIQISSVESFSSLLVDEIVDGLEYSYSFSDTGTFYWRINAEDRAGNIGSFSSKRQIIVE
ncbi:hypothetical protein [Aureivirga marina]|uniref:hypothetical protein n=1 Tax=Aureivirga marina TaxID=1182451 RepID=UPI0018CB1177|nr:hypothetical protein [Aureivirga marina]